MNGSYTIYRHPICGMRLVDYTGFSIEFANTAVDNQEVKAALTSRSIDSNVLRNILFKGPVQIVHRISLIFSFMNLKKLDQQIEIFDFLSWLKNVVKPFLDHVQHVIPDVLREVDLFLSQRSPSLTLEKMMMLLKQHLTEHSLCIFSAITLRLTNTKPTRIDCPILRLAMAELQRRCFYVDKPRFVRRSGLSLKFNELEIRLSNILRIYGIYYRRNLVMPYCRFHFHRLLNDGNFVQQCLRRVCSGTSSN